MEFTENIHTSESPIIYDNSDGNSSSTNSRILSLNIAEQNANRIPCSTISSNLQNITHSRHTNYELPANLNKNKESLKVKLMTRRPICQLVEQGIVPSTQVSPLLHEKRLHLERFKTGAILKAKIERRPTKGELIQQHILPEYADKMDASLITAHSRLRRARLADRLNDQLSQRPGPLELVRDNILHTSRPDIEQAVRDGQLTFEPTTEDVLDSVSTPSPQDVCTKSPPTNHHSNSTAVCVTNSVNTVSGTQNSYSSVGFLFNTVSVSNITTTYSSSTSLSSVHSSKDSDFSYITPSMSLTTLPSSAEHRINLSTTQVMSINPHSMTRTTYVKADRRRRKSLKSNTNCSKARVIKFHEYKGPNCRSSSCCLGNGTYIPSPPTVSKKECENSYELLLKQQQMFLQWQLEYSRNYPQLLLPSNHKALNVSAASFLHNISSAGVRLTTAAIISAPSSAANQGNASLYTNSNKVVFGVNTCSIGAGSSRFATGQCHVIASKVSNSDTLIVPADVTRDIGRNVLRKSSSLPSCNARFANKEEVNLSSLLGSSINCNTSNFNPVFCLTPNYSNVVVTPNVTFSTSEPILHTPLVSSCIMSSDTASTSQTATDLRTSDILRVSDIPLLPTHSIHVQDKVRQLEIELERSQQELENQKEHIRRLQREKDELLNKSAMDESLDFADKSICSINAVDRVISNAEMNKSLQNMTNCDGDVSIADLSFPQPNFQSSDANQTINLDGINENDFCLTDDQLPNFQGLVEQMESVGSDDIFFDSLLSPITENETFHTDLHMDCCSELDKQIDSILANTSSFMYKPTGYMS